MKLEGNKYNAGFDSKPENINRQGSPKGKRTSTIIKEMLQGDVSKFSDNADVKGLDTNTAIVVKLIGIVFHNDTTNRDKLNAIREILDRTEGKPLQSIDIENTIPENNLINKLLQIDENIFEEL